jgi:hypothetical protein
MNNNSILVENENKRLTFRLPLLICFALYVAWQMGVVFFSGKTLSLDGKTPLPVNVDNLTILIAAGYILSIIVMIALPRLVVWLERITTAVALLSALILYLPFSNETLAAFYYLQCFCCMLMIGFETFIIINFQTEKNALKHLTIAYAFAMVCVAILHNDIIDVSFSGFRFFAVISLALMLVFFFKLPVRKDVLPRYVKKEDNIVAPKSLIAGILLMVGLNCFVTLFGNTVAENATHGLSVYYLSTAVFGLIIFLLWKKFNINPLKCGSVLLALGAMGFIAAIATCTISVYTWEFSMIACTLLGAGMACCWLNPLFGLLIVKRYPSRYIAPAIIGIAFITVLIHTVLLDALRDSVTILYVVYLVIAVILVILYLMLAP